MLALPWRDNLQEFIVFRTFHNGIDAGKIRTQDFMQGRGFLEQIQCLPKYARDVFYSIICIAFELFVGTFFF